MNKAFFDSVRTSLFGGALYAGQVDGINELERAWRTYGDGDDKKFAYILAGVFHESAKTMQPVRETLADTDEQAIAKLEKAWREGKLKWVKTPYWRRDSDGFAWFGRGRIQNTHKANAEKLERRFNINFTKNPNLFLDSKIDAMVTVVGHMEGIWTGKKLGDYIDSPLTLVKGWVEARRVVNGTDKQDLIAGYAAKFYNALQLAKAAGPMPLPDDPGVDDGDTDLSPEQMPMSEVGGTARVMAAIIALLAIAGGILTQCTGG